MDIQVLISEVQFREPLWDRKNIHHNNREMIDNLWDEVATLLRMPREAVKTKWKGLRDTFRRELKKVMSRSTSVNENSTNWNYFSLLLFLKDNMLSRLHADISWSDCEDDAKMLLRHDEPPATETEAPEMNLNTLVGDLPGIQHVDKPESDRQLKRVCEYDDVELVASDRKRMSVMDRDDDDYHFLMSLLPTMKKLPIIRKMYLRLKFQELLFTEVANPQS